MSDTAAVEVRRYENLEQFQADAGSMANTGWQVTAQSQQGDTIVVTYSYRGGMSDSQKFALLIFVIVVAGAVLFVFFSIRGGIAGML